MLQNIHSGYFLNDGLKYKFFGLLLWKCCIFTMEDSKIQDQSEENTLNF